MMKSVGKVVLINFGHISKRFLPIFKSFPKYIHLFLRGGGVPPPLCLRRVNDNSAIGLKDKHDEQ